MVDVTGQPTALTSWPELVLRRFTPRQHTRVGAVLLFSLPLIGNEFVPTVNLVRNPHSAVAVPAWIDTTVESFREEHRHRFGRTD
jgi:hypothetical protein